MTRKCTGRFVSIGLTAWLLSIQSASAIDNIRAAHPSISASVRCLMIANKEGYYKEEGINVEFLSIRGEIAIRTTLAGEIDFFTNAGNALAAVARNVPVKILAVLQDKPGWDLIALPNIKSIAQLRGQTVAIMSPEGSLAVVTREILRKNGLDPTKTLVWWSWAVTMCAFQRSRPRRSKRRCSTPRRACARRKTASLNSPRLASTSIRSKAGWRPRMKKIKQQPGKIARFMRASLKGVTFYLIKRDAAIKYSMDILRIKDREMAGAIYDEEARLSVRDGISDAKILQPMIDEMKAAVKSQKDLKLADVFDFSFVRKANEELKASGWKP